MVLKFIFFIIIDDVQECLPNCNVKTLEARGNRQFQVLIKIYEVILINTSL